MTHFSLNPGMVRGELFTENGKWKYTVQINMYDFYNEVDIYEAVVKAFRATPSSTTGVVEGITGYWLVVLDPYHRNAYPVMVRI